MSEDASAERAVEMSVPPKARARIEALMAEPTGDFRASVRILIAPDEPRRRVNARQQTRR